MPGVKLNPARFMSQTCVAGSLAAAFSVPILLWSPIGRDVVDSGWRRRSGGATTCSCWCSRAGVGGYGAPGELFDALGRWLREECLTARRVVPGDVALLRGCDDPREVAELTMAAHATQAAMAGAVRRRPSAGERVPKPGSGFEEP